MKTLAAETQNPEQRRSVIRFALHQLGSQNGHHTFEHICRNLAAQRIASNILPATGPVAAGGDQGRDFETFPTYLRSEDVPGSSFIALVSEGAAAFACTLQQDKLQAKLNTDVAAIAGSGQPVERIFFMCEADVAVGTRHKWEKGATATSGIDVRVLDGNWIADQLTKADTFWIAEQFLSLPAELAPPAEEDGTDSGASWYEALRARWREIETPAGTFGEFSELKSALRHATHADDLRDDLPFWIGRAETFAHVAPPGLRRRAFYEIAVASLIGLGTMRGYENRLSEYFAQAGVEEDPVALEDAQNLLMFTTGGVDRGKAEITEDQLAEWAAALDAHITQLEAKTTSPDAKAHLLQTLGSLRLRPDTREPYAGVEAKVPATMETWGQMLAVLPDAPLFPVDRFASILAVVAPLLVDHHGYREMTRTVDSLVAERAGRSAAAERCRDRAMALFSQGQLLAAIREFHEARIEWFTGDTLRGSLLATSLIAHCYDRLHLEYAGKYYWLAFASSALASNVNDLLDFPAKGVLHAAQNDYRSGATFGFFNLFEIGFRLHGQLEENAWDVEEHETLQMSYVSLAAAYTYARKSGPPELLTWIDELLDDLGITDMVRELSEEAEAIWGDDAEILADWFMSELGVPIFADAGDDRVIRWRALGIDWIVEFSNDYETTIIGERFAALTQIVLADLASDDLALMPTSVSIRVVQDDDEATAAPTTNTNRQWIVRLAPEHGRDSDEVQVKILTALTLILRDVSVLPDHELNAVIEDSFKRGLAAKIFPLASYDAVMRHLITADAFASEIRKQVETPAVSVETRFEEHPELVWDDSPGPTYSETKARELINNRYANTVAGLPRTLPRLLQHTPFRELVAELRAAGWQDWRILSAILSVALNWRLNNVGERPRSQSEWKSRSLALRSASEDGLPDVPLDEFSREALEHAEQMSLPANLMAWELQFRQFAPDFDAMRRFLGVRYFQFDDDVEHEDVFGGDDERVP